jgi:two-component system LytT family response regulator
MRVLLVDDEPAARERLHRLLKGFDDLEIVGEAEDGEQAIERIAELTPDLVFLDIQMPGCSGMEVAASLKSPRPQIIFCTAYDEYAVEAFELHAVDYLLKPVSRARLVKAIERTRVGAVDQIDRVAESSGRWPTRFLAKRRKHYCVVPVGDVLFFASDGGQTQLQATEHHYWMQPTLGELELRLDPQLFFRISRTAIVRMDAVREVLPLSGGQGEILLANDTHLEISRRRFKELLERLGGSS